MKFEFDGATGFLVTKALAKLRKDAPTEQKVSVDASQSNSNNSTVTNNYQAPKENKRPKIIHEKPKRKAIPTVRNNSSNQYYTDSRRVIDKGGNLLGGELYSAVNEIMDITSSFGRFGRMATAPFRMIGSAKGGISNYLNKRNDKKEQRTEIKENKEAQKQTDTLDNILDEMKQGQGSSKFSLGGGLLKGGMVGGVTSALFGGGIKGLLKKLGIGGLIFSVVDNFSDEIEAFKSSRGKTNGENLTLTEKLQFVSNQLGKGVAELSNAILGTAITDEEIENLTAGLREKISTATSNLKDNFPKFGEAIENTFTALDKGLGDATAYISDMAKVALDSLRKKSDKEKEFIKAQDTIRNRDILGETLSGTNDAEYAKAKETRKRLAPALLKDKEFRENSPYVQAAKDAMNQKIEKGQKLKEAKAKKKKIDSQVKREELEVKDLEQLKADVEEGKLLSKAKLAFMYSSKEAFEDELKTKKHHLEQHKKLADTADEIIKKLQSTLDGMGETEYPIPASYNTEVDGLWKQNTMEYEGFRGKIYKDSKKHETIGYGHKLTNAEKRSGKYKNGISKIQAKELFALDKAKHNKKLYSKFGWIKEQPAQVREALEDMAFNMGVGNGDTGGLSGFKNTLKLIKAGKYEEASKSMLDSQYAKDVGKRATDNSKRIASAKGIMPNTKDRVAKVSTANITQATKTGSAIQNSGDSNKQNNTKTATQEEANKPTDQTATITADRKRQDTTNTLLTELVRQGNSKPKQKAEKTQAPRIVVNIENKSTNTSIGGEV